MGLIIITFVQYHPKVLPFNNLQSHHNLPFNIHQSHHHLLLKLKLRLIIIIIVIIPNFFILIIQIIGHLINFGFSFRYIYQLTFRILKTIFLHFLLYRHNRLFVQSNFGFLLLVCKGYYQYRIRLILFQHLFSK